MKKTQDPKYGIEDGKLVNIASGVAIPDNEPIFILRGKDILSLQVIQYYETFCATNEHKAAVNSRVEEFTKFQRENREVLKMPDTVFPYPEPDDK